MRLSRSNGPGNCPYCGCDTILKNGRYGEFYGCIRYPHCTGSRNFKGIEMNEVDWKDLTKRLDKLERKSVPWSKKKLWYTLWLLLMVVAMSLIGVSICCAYCWTAIIKYDTEWACSYPAYMSLYVAVPGVPLSIILSVFMFFLAHEASEKQRRS